MALEVSALTRTFPKHEQYELARQLRASARSIPANIAEGWAKRQSAAEFRRHLQIAIGSCEETQVWLDKTLTPELIREGLVREIIRRVNDLRKKSGLDREAKPAEPRNRIPSGCPSNPPPPGSLLIDAPANAPEREKPDCSAQLSQL